MCFRWTGQQALLGPDARVRHRAKRRRLKTVMQADLSCGQARPAGSRWVLDFGRVCAALLASTGARGEYVAGVRYKAWNPPSSLHPTIDDTPLVFDIVDTWTGRAIGGCTDHVSHSGGRSYDTFPVNASEA